MKFASLIVTVCTLFLGPARADDHATKVPPTAAQSTTSTDAQADPTAANAPPPNIVFFFTDDQTTSTLGCYGNDVIQTPNIDALAANGVLFRNAFVSQSICWMSRTTILSGLTGRTYGTPGNPELARPEAVAELYTDILHGRGYRTGFFGKWNARMPKDFQRQDHFDEIEAIGRNPYYKKQPDGTLRHETDLVVDRGIEFVRNQPQGKPFSLNLYFNACHAEDSDRRPGIGHYPWPESANGMYEDVEIAQPPLNATEVFDALPDFLKTTINRERFFWRWNTDHKYQANMRAYYRMVSGIDDAIGRFLSVLGEQGLADNTIIVYSADNGYYMANRGMAGKWSHYEESLRVPLIIMDPRVDASQRGTTTDAIGMNLDLPATFLDWAGAEIPQRYQGFSLAPIVAGNQPEDWRTETFHEHYAVRNRIPAFEGLRNERFKYVVYFDDDNYEFLHDLKNDPNELVNVADDPEYASTVSVMRQRLAERVEELGGPLVKLNKPFNKSTVPHPVASANVGANVGQDGFVSVFDGKTLHHWSGDPKYWSVQDGALTGVTDGSLQQNHFITWEDSTIRNIDLRVKVKVSEGGNSGIQYRGLSRPDLGLDVVTGYQCDVVADNPNYNGMLYEERGRRILSHTGEKVIVDPEGRSWVVGNTFETDSGTDASMPADLKNFDTQRWHDYRVLVRGNHHQHWIDGHLTTDLIDLDASGRSLEGVLAVQVHVGPAMKIQYKDFKIKHLPDDIPLVTSSENPISDDAHLVRPQAKLPADWTPPTYGTR